MHHILSAMDAQVYKNAVSSVPDRSFVTLDPAGRVILTFENLEPEECISECDKESKCEGVLISITRKCTLMKSIDIFSVENVAEMTYSLVKTVRYKM